jgi:TM2 domain-containing membrane protein YozV
MLTTKATYGKPAHIGVICSWFTDSTTGSLREVGMDNASFLSLTPSEPIETAPVMFDPQPVPKSPLLAFLLSLVIPGAGQMYCGKTSPGLWTLAFFLPGLALTINFTRQLGGPEGKEIALFWGFLLRTSLFLYVFAFLDAFFTAREMTAGTGAFIAENPRVAAILNLLTRGFGYFYLGQRKLGLWIFFGLMFLQAPLAQTAGGSVLMEFVMAAMGIRAYSIARESEKQILATVRLSPEPASRGLPAAVPIGLAAVLAAGYIALLFTALLMPDYSQVDQSRAQVSQDSEGLFYQNPTYDVSLRAPAGWSIKNDEPDYLLLAVRWDRGCSVTLQPMRWSLLVGLDSFKAQLAYQLSKVKDLSGAVLDEQPAVVAGLSGRDIRVSFTQGGQPMIAHHFIARQGMTLYDLSTYELAGVDAEAAESTCAADFNFIRKNLVLPR